MSLGWDQSEDSFVEDGIVVVDDDEDIVVEEGIVLGSVEDDTVGEESIVCEDAEGIALGIVEEDNSAEKEGHHMDYIVVGTPLSEHHLVVGCGWYQRLHHHHHPSYYHHLQAYKRS